MGCQCWGVFRKWQPPLYACKGVFWAYEWFVVAVVVSLLSFGLPGFAFDSVFLVFDCGRSYVLYVVESATASKLVSEDCCGVAGGLTS